jgi:hypothetical protein
VGNLAGLHLYVKPTGAKSWVLRMMLGGKRKDMGLGAYPDVPLAQARERARVARDQAWKGINPIAHQAQQRSTLAAAAMTAASFEDAAGQFIKSKASEWSNFKHGQQWAATLEQHAYATVGKLLLSDIGLTQVLAALEPIWTSKTETASRVRQRLEAVLSYATVAAAPIRRCVPQAIGGRWIDRQR